MNEHDHSESQSDVRRELDQLIRWHCARLDSVEFLQAMGCGFGIGALVGGLIVLVLVEVRSDWIIYGAVILLGLITAVWCEGGRQKALACMMQERKAFLARLPADMRDRAWDEYYRRVLCGPRDPGGRNK